MTDRKKFSTLGTKEGVSARDINWVGFWESRPASLSTREEGSSHFNRLSTAWIARLEPAWNRAGCDNASQPSLVLA